MEFLKWIIEGWGYYILAIGGVGALWNSFKLIKEIKENISKPVKELTSTVDKIDKGLTNLDNRLTDHIANFEEERAKQLRMKILEFSDSILVGAKHSKETYDDMLVVIDDYDKYCNAHPDFKNNRCKLAIENITNVYRKKTENSNFSI